MSLFAQKLKGEYATMWAGTLLRKFIRRPATLYLVGNELHVVFDPFPDQEALRPLLDRLNAKRGGIVLAEQPGCAVQHRSGRTPAPADGARKAATTFWRWLAL